MIPQRAEQPVSNHLLTTVFTAALLTLVPGCDNAANQNAIQPEAARVAFQSQCAQNVITCTDSFPEAVIDVEAIHGQSVTATDTGFLIEQPGTAPIWTKLIGSDSDPGDNATEIQYRWSSRAEDADPCSLDPGPEFSTEADPLVLLEPGFHYIRLTVTNDNIIGQLESDECGIIGQNIPAYDFLEVEIEVRHQ